MKQHSAFFSVHLSRQTGSLERLISRIRRRGFSVQSMIVTQRGSNDGFHVEMQLLGHRSFETLAKHLANLVDVTTISLKIPHTRVEYCKLRSSDSTAVATV